MVTVVDTTAPSLGQPADITYEYGSLGHSIVWTISDLYPGDYSILQDGVVVESDSWEGKARVRWVRPGEEYGRSSRAVSSSCCTAAPRL